MSQSVLFTYAVFEVRYKFVEMKITTVRRKKLIVDRAYTYQDNSSKITLLTGAANHAWRLRGGDEKGSGWRSPAITWKEGESGKQNKSLEPYDGFSSNTVSFFTLSVFL